MAFSSSSQGTNAERSRTLNRQAVLGCIQSAGAMGRAQIARHLHLSTQAVSNIIADLTEEGLLLEKGTLSAGRGLPAVQYAVNPTGGYAMGLEIRPDAIFAALIDLEGHAVSTQRHSLDHASPQVVMKHVYDLKRIVLEDADVVPSRLLGAGVVMPGPFGQTGLSGESSDLPGWDALNPKALFEDALNVPIELSNDANAAAMAERISGVAHGVQTYAYLYFGAGLGLGLVNQGRLVSGAFGNAGEIGHIPIPTARGTVPLETALSRLSLQQHLSNYGVLDFNRIAALHETGDAALEDWLDAATPVLAYAVQIVENLFDPQTIILGGAMPSSILDHLVDKAPLPGKSVSNRSDSPLPRLQRGASGRLTATFGAAALILNRAFTPQTITLN